MVAALNRNSSLTKRDIPELCTKLKLLGFPSTKCDRLTTISVIRKTTATTNMRRMSGTGPRNFHTRFLAVSEASSRTVRGVAGATISTKRP
jgi:hypothetical protein